MRAAVFTEPGEPLEIRDVPYPEPPADGIVVETVACGVCRSDWHVWRGDWGWIGVEPSPGQVFGHEPVGTVAAVGEDVESLREADRVAVPFNLSDGTCYQCRNGRANVCESLLPLGFAEPAPGAFAEAFPVRAAEQNVVPVPDGVDPLSMAGLGCRFATAFHALAHRADLAAGDWVAVHGCGGVGLSAVQIGSALGANVVAVDIEEAKLDRARDLGAVEVVDASATDRVAREVRALTDGGAHVAMDALGIAETCRNAVESLRRRGQHLQVGLTTDEEGGEVALPTDAMVMKELEVVGCFGMQPTRYDELLRMVESGRLDPGAVVSETVALEDVPETLAAMEEYATAGIPVVTEF